MYDSTAGARRCFGFSFRFGAGLMMPALLLCFAIQGCDTGGDQPAPPPVTGHVQEAEREESQGYVRTVIRAPRSAQERTAVISVENQLNQYKALHGEWPASLEVLGEWGHLPALPGNMQYHYDAEEGKVLIREAIQ